MPDLRPSPLQFGEETQSVVVSSVPSSAVPQRLSSRDDALTTLPVFPTIATQHRSSDEHVEGRCRSARASMQFTTRCWSQPPTALLGKALLNCAQFRRPLPPPSLQRLSSRDVALTTLPVPPSIATPHRSSNGHVEGRCWSARAPMQLTSRCWPQHPTALLGACHASQLPPGVWSALSDRGNTVLLHT